ncbi:MAG: glutathione S-transferase family protein [Salaquimonas sp.]
MLVLEIFEPNKLGIRNASPACLKAEALMILSGVPYQLKSGDVRKSPTGKFPILHDGGEIIADSSHILEHLRAKYSFTIDSDLTDEQKAISHTLQHMLEEHQYFITVYFRWMENPKLMREELFVDIPNPIRKIIFSIIHNKQKKALHLQGTSRHSRVQLIEMARDNFKAIAGLLGNKNYVLGDKIHSVDAVVFAQIEAAFSATVPTPLKDMAHDFPTLTKYLDRFRDEVFGAKPA